MEIEFVSRGPVEGEPLSAIAAPAFDGPTLTGAGEALDAAAGGALSRAFAGSRFTGAKGEVLDLIAPAGRHASRAVLVGAGPEDALSPLAAEAIGAGAYHAVRTSGVQTLELRLDDLADDLAARVAFGARI